MKKHTNVFKLNGKTGGGGGKKAPVRNWGGGGNT